MVWTLSSLIISSLHLPLIAGHISWLSFRPSSIETLNSTKPYIIIFSYLSSFTVSCACVHVNLYHHTQLLQVTDSVYNGIIPHAIVCNIPQRCLLPQQPKWAASMQCYVHHSPILSCWDKLLLITDKCGLPWEVFPYHWKECRAQCFYILSFLWSFSLYLYLKKNFLLTFFERTGTAEVPTYLRTQSQQKNTWP